MNISDVEIKAIEQVIEMLPSYEDPDWKTQLDNIMLDIDVAKEMLIELVKTTKP